MPSARRGGLNKICLVPQIVRDLFEQPALLPIEQELPRGLRTIFDQLAVEPGRREALGSRDDVVDILRPELIEAFLILFPLPAIDLRLPPGRGLFQRRASDAIGKRDGRGMTWSIERPDPASRRERLRMTSSPSSCASIADRSKSVILSPCLKL
jgi:hypothetical protein